MRVSKTVLAAAVALLMAAGASAQQTPLTSLSEAALKAEAARLGVQETKLLVKMRDGIGLSTDIIRPKADGKYPTIFIRTPYNMNVHGPSDQRLAVEAMRRGYAVIWQNERGRYFSEGKYKILGYPQTDGYDMLSWIAAQPWSNGKVGTLGCSSTAEWQMSLAAMNHPAHAAMIPQSAGAGIGRMGEYAEHGNWYRGGVPRTLFAVWIYGTDNPQRAQYPANLTPEERRRLSQYWDLNPAKPKVNWQERTKTLPVSEWLTGMGEPRGTYEEFIDAKGPADPYWYSKDSGLYHDDMAWGTPALHFNTWYDVSVAPNMAMYNHARAKGVDQETRDNQYVIVAPNPHCSFFGSPNAKVGDRSLGDTSFDYQGEVWKFWDRFLKGDANAFPSSTPKVRYYSMGDNAWRSADRWPPASATETKLYLHSNGRANSLYGDGRLAFEAPPARQPSDSFVYDPAAPVQTIGGGDCCNGGLVIAGPFDQRPIEVRQDVLVYSTEPLKEAVTVAGFIDAVLYVSSSAKDTDFAVKLVDVAPDGTAYILDDTILRARYRDGFDKEVFMSPGGIYRLDLSAMATANTFLPGHRIRVEITSSNFPKHIRNLNTGGRNEFEKTWVVATNTVHHAGANASYITLPIVRR